MRKRHQHEKDSIPVVIKEMQTNTIVDWDFFFLLIRFVKCKRLVTPNTGESIGSLTPILLVSISGDSDIENVYTFRPSSFISRNMSQGHN